MSPRPLFWLGSVLLLAACDDQIVSPPAAEAAPEERPKLTFGTPQYDGANAATVDGWGYVYVAGRTDGSLDGPHQGKADFFVRKYHPTGDVIWANQFGTHLNDWANGIAVDTDGNVYVVGQTEGSLAGSRGNMDAFVRKYDTNGVLQWTRQYGEDDNSDYATAVAVSPDGSTVYIVGTSVGHSLNSQPSGFVSKFDSDGVLFLNFFWNAANGAAVNFTGVAVDPLGHVYVVGYTAGPLACCSQGGVDAFIGKFDASIHVAIWWSQFGTARDDHAYAVAVDLDGNLVIVGATLVADQSRWGGKEDWNAALWTRRHDGLPLTFSHFGSGASDRAYAVSVSPFNEFFVVGVTDGALQGSSAGASDVFVRAYAAGSQPLQPLWTRQFGTSADDRAFAVAASGDVSGLAPDSRRVYIAGATAGTLVGANRGKYDAFLRRMDGSGNVSWTDQ